MDKGLEALERIGKCYVNSESKDLMFTDDYGDDYDIIERELKALEIIKKKRVACDLLTNPDVTDYKKYNSHCDKYDFIVPLTEEEFNLLKGILNDEQ